MPFGDMAIRLVAVSLSLVGLASLGSASAAPQPAKALEVTQPASPAKIVAAAPAKDWRTIRPRDLLVMDLPALGQSLTPVGESVGTGEAPVTKVAPAAPRRVIIQLIAPPYSQGWATNIRVLAAANWWDGLAIVRAQDNYVVQWGDPEAAHPQLARRLPRSLQKMPPQDYLAGPPGDCGEYADICPPSSLSFFTSEAIRDVYADRAGFVAGWPVAVTGARSWPVHCYGTVGVGRDMAPDTGTGAELYAVIGHAPRQLDRNIAVVGRVIEGIEHLSSLPRGTAELGFYATPEEQTPILSIRLGDEVEDLPRYEYLASTSDSFARYVKARANRHDAFYTIPAGAVDVCNVPVPIRRASAPSSEVEPGRKPARRR
ncbi:peptidylprolyl isomerase [Novosphingobium sp. RD2P27]|uniref:Peptidylprolyl isomerase n=1 Tax=Novosphingobium kalidii TaxID=3230299 RepID=A0ABV2CX09_9SPHN